MDLLKQAIAERLYELGAVKFGSFRLKLHEKFPDAPESPIYFNLRTADHPKNPGPLDAKVMEYIGLAMALEAELNGQPFNYFTGLPAAGEPFADALQMAMEGWEPRPERITLIKHAYPDGTRHVDEMQGGPFLLGGNVVVLDDLVTQADTKLEGIQVLETNGLTVVLVMVLIDRMQGGRQQLESRGYTMKALFTIEELLDFYVERKWLEAPKATEVMKYIADNQA